MLCHPKVALVFHHPVGRHQPREWVSDYDEALWRVLVVLARPEELLACTILLPQSILHCLFAGMCVKDDHEKMLELS